ncbi:NucA/NucB deoxyribonuclease domain-containing protein [Streptomyces sp. NPDC003233]
MKRAGRTSCDEYPFASTYEGGTNLPASERTIKWVNKQENNSQGGAITTWRRQFHVMDHDPLLRDRLTLATGCATPRGVLPRA